MKVQCKFDDKYHIVRFNNVLVVENGYIVGEVALKITTVSGEEEAMTIVDGKELIKAIENAMNV